MSFQEIGGKVPGMRGAPDHGRPWETMGERSPERGGLPRWAGNRSKCHRLDHEEATMGKQPLPGSLPGFFHNKGLLESGPALRGRLCHTPLCTHTPVPVSPSQTHTYLHTCPRHTAVSMYTRRLAHISLTPCISSQMSPDTHLNSHFPDTHTLE